MGYTLTVPCRNKEAQAEMLAFLDEYYREPETFIDDFEDGGCSVPHGGPFAYHKDVGEHIGIDYTSWAPEKDWAISVIRWIALRVGDRKLLPVFEEEDWGPSAEVPYYIYDGTEDMAIRLKDEWYGKGVEHCKKWIYVDEHGWNVNPQDTPMAKFFRFFSREHNEQLHNELKRLSELWDARKE